MDSWLRDRRGWKDRSLESIADGVNDNAARLQDVKELVERVVFFSTALGDTLITQIIICSFGSVRTGSIEGQVAYLHSQGTCDECLLACRRMHHSGCPYE